MILNSAADDGKDVERQRNDAGCRKKNGGCREGVVWVVAGNWKRVLGRAV